MLFTTPVMMMLASAQIAFTLPHMRTSDMDVTAKGRLLMARSVAIPEDGHSVDTHSLALEFARMRRLRSRLLEPEPVLVAQTKPMLQRRGIRSPRVKPANASAKPTVSKATATASASPNTTSSQTPSPTLTPVANPKIKSSTHHVHNISSIPHPHVGRKNVTTTPIVLVPSTINVTVVYSLNTTNANATSNSTLPRRSVAVARSRKVSPGVQTFVRKPSIASKRDAIPKTRKASPAIEVFRASSTINSASSTVHSKRSVVSKERKRSPALDTFKARASESRLRAKRSLVAADDSTTAETEEVRAAQPTQAEIQAVQQLSSEPEHSSGRGAGPFFAVRNREKRYVVDAVPVESRGMGGYRRSIPTPKAQPASLL
ncbi:BZ3500_MvSof-1268-A1-R1_Chr7-1g09451 [Microbotryum saponariae]|uniref:BZ3500_MvSof-1268-A1-R1_Chr7-1g09451 protein n=1 Tax=Microbotryum saponariae TaxID=289078 RepID=A0A2X0M343_9BASI|nr:BZ3501_MvSof-1269-A2-R1_Chr7-1g09156 [Microbotryum saponariae]SDA03475.1 BZ3500_MvSof-1268-A1-R1_Chr7-1g09451 [Microbotryum saponariae]